MGQRLKQTAGGFGFAAGLCGYYAAAHYLCGESLVVAIPMGGTGRLFGRGRKGRSE